MRRTVQAMRSQNPLSSQMPSELCTEVLPLLYRAEVACLRQSLAIARPRSMKIASADLLRDRISVPPIVALE